MITGLLVDGSPVVDPLILKIISSTQALNRISFVTPHRHGLPEPLL
jgi:hypothetical protein